MCAVSAGDDRDALLARGLAQRVARKMGAEAQIIVPAVPALVDDYVAMLATQFEALGRSFTSVELRSLGELLLTKLREGFDVSPHSNVFVRYRTDPFPAAGITYEI